MSIFTAIKARVRKDLNDRGVILHSKEELDYSVQDAYDDIALLSRCIVKKTTVDFGTSSYYDFKSLGVSDFLAVTAIFNNNTNRWLLDNKTIRDFDLIRDNWELWNGTPQWWAASGFKHTVLVPHYSEVPLQQMDLYYWAVAPLVSNEASPLIPKDLETLFDTYCTGDLLESVEEFKKADQYLKLYYESIEMLRERIQNQAKRDLLRLA